MKFENKFGDSVTASEKGIVVNMAGGGRIVLGDWGGSCTSGIEKDNPMQFPQVLTTPKPWGIQVKWQWPEGCEQYSHLEIQYLYSGGDLKKQILGWPCESMTIGGLKAGERLQIRLRPIDKNGTAREWTQGDWIEGVASNDAGEYLDAMTVGSDTRLMTTFSSPKFKIENGQVFINNAFISGTIHAAEPPKSKASNDIDVGKILDEAWKCGCRSAAEGVEALARAASAYAQDYKQHASGGETSASTYSVSMHINLNDAQPASGVDSNVEAILKNALASDKAMADFEEAIRKAIRKECQPGGAIWHHQGR